MSVTAPKQSYSRIILLFTLFLVVSGPKIYAQCTGQCPVIAGVNINSCSGVITISVTGDGPFTYDWRDSGGTQVSTSFIASGLVADNYTVTITDVDGDTETATYTVTNPPNLTGSAVVNDVTCRGDSDAQVVVTMTNGNPDYEWELFNGGGASIGTGTAPPFSNIITLGGLGVDNYTLAVTDDNGCTGTVTFSVTQPVDFLGHTAPSSMDATCFDSSDGSVSAMGTGGWGDYVYQWERVSDGAVVGNTAIVNGLAPGDYRLVIVDRNGTGCTITTPNVTVGSPPEIVLSANIDDALCNGASNGEIDLNITGGVAPYTYSWSNGAVSEDISGLAAGSYTVDIEDDAGCTASATFTVGEPAVLAINEIITDVACFGDATGEIESNVTGGTAPYTYNWSNGASSADISSLAAGTYDLTVTDDNGCSITLNNIAVAEPAAALSKQSDSQANPSCAGYNDGEVTITMQGGTGPYSYSWSNGDNTATASNLTAGLHTVTVTDNNGCIYTETFTLSDPPSIIVTPSLTAPSCNGAADGQISVVASNGTAPYVYSWNTGDSGPTINGLVAGTYTVTVTDQNGAGCTVVETINLGQPAVLNDNALVNDISCNGANDGSIFLAVTGGTGPYDYLWNTGATTNNISGLSAGGYSVTITDDNGCSIVRNYNIVDPPAIGVSHTQVDILCKGATTGEIDITPSGGTAPYTYSWSDDGTITAQDRAGLAAGSYTVTVTDDEGCSVGLTVTLTEPATVMTLSGTETDGTCAGSNNGSINLTVTGGTGSYTYSWNNGATIEDISGLAPGNYSVTVTDNVGCSKSIGFTISEPSPISVSETLTNVSCNGASDGTISLAVGGGTGGYTYSWADDVTIITKDRTGLGPGNYTITVEDASGCLYVESFNITQPDVLSSTATQLNVSCFGESAGSIDLTISGGSAPYTFLWSNGAITEDLTNIPAGNYSVDITDAEGCTDSKSFTITEPPSALAVTSSVTQITCNGAADGIINLSVSGGSAPYTFNWSHGSTDEDLNSLSAGIYNVTVTDDNGCTFVDSFTITDPPVLTLNEVVTDIDCNGADNGEIDITVGGGEGPYTFAWSNGETTEDVSNLSPGNYTVTVTDARGCTITDNYNISQPIALGFSYTSDDVSCFGLSDGAIDITITGGTAPYDYSWSNTEITEDISGLAAGDYTVTVTDFNGCTLVETITITQPVAPLSDAGVANDISCFGGSDGSIQLNPTGGTAPYTYDWSNGATTKDISGLSDGTYQVIIEDFNGCTITETFTINMPTAMLASGTQTNILCNGDATGAIDLTVSGGTTPYTYTWNSGASTQDLTNITAGNYQVTIEDASGCSLIRNFTITEPLALLIGENVQDVSCFGVSDGFIDLSVSGGIAPYTYLWSNGATTQDLFNISGGNYSVDITDGNNCVTTRNYTIAEPTSALNVTGSVVDENCFGDNQGAISLTVTGGTAPYSYSWNHGPTVKDVGGLGRGAYQVTVTDNNGCSVTTDYTVSGPDALQLSAVPTQIDCNGAANGELDVTVTGGTAPYTYAWGGGATSEDLTNLAPGNHSLTVTDANGCTISGSWTITQPLAISIGQTTTDVTCFGASDGAIDITVSGGISPYTYSWSNGATSQDLSGISGGSYTVTITDANGCIASGTYAVGEPAAALSANGAVSDEICFGDNQGSVILTVAGGTAPYTYLWNNGATTKDIAGLSPATYQVTITDANGCFIQEDFTVGGPTALASTSIVANVSCNGASDGSIDITPSGGTAPYTFSWSNGATTEDISGLGSNNYSVIITDANGCTLNKNYSITQPTAIGITSSKSDVSCFGALDGSVSITVIGGTLPYSYSWSSGETTKDISGLPGGSYTLTVTDGNACTSSVTVVIDEPAAALAVSGIVTDESCFGDSQGAIDLTVSGGTAPYTYSWDHGSSLQDVNGLGRGTYQVTVTDANGCSVVESYSVSGPNALQISAIANQIDCNAAADGELDVTVTGGTGPYTYSWSNGASTEDLTGLVPNTYTLTVTDASGCISIGSWTITQPLAISVGENISDVACFGDGDGAIDITVSGGVAPYTYLWSTGATSQDISGLSGGNYSVDITDANGCITTRNYTIDEPVAALTVSDVVTDENCFGDAQGAIALTVNGGTAPYTYSWNHGPTTRDVSNLVRGTYQVTVTDANGCSVVNSYVVSGPDALQLSAVPTQIDCNGAANGELDVTVLSGTAPYTYSWSNSSAAEDLTGLSPGNYALTVTDANGCTISGSWTITQPLAISVGESITDVTCFGAADGAIDITVSGGISPYTYDWSNGATSQDLSGLSGGNYSVTITDANGCEVIRNYTVDEPVAALSVNGAVADEDCFGDLQGSIVLTVTGGTGPYTYLWSNGSITKDIAGLARGNYEVTVTDANGCLVTTDFTVGGPAILSATEVVTDILCNGANTGSIDISVSGGTAPYTYLWSNGATTEDISGLSPSNYSIAITDANGCTLNKNYSITQPTAIGITSSKTDVSCFAAGDGSISVNVIGGTLPYSYSWSNGATTKNISGLSGGSYTLTVTDSNACTSSTTIVIDEPAAALAVSGVVTDESCFGDSQGAVDLTVTGGTAPYSYSWDHGSSSQDITGLARGTYQVTVTDANGCSVIESFTVAGPDALQVSAVATQIDCNGAANGALDVTVVGGVGPYTYSWSNGASAEDLTSLAPGNYNLTVTDANGCISTGSWTITQPLAISVGESITDVACFGDGDGAIDITVSGGIAPYSYSWSTGANSQDISGLSGGNYSVTITDANGCIDVRNYLVDEPASALSISGIVTDETCFGDSQGAVDLSVSGGTAPYTYSWNQGSNTQDITGLGRGTYQVSVTDANGCSVTSDFTVSGPDVLQVSAIPTQIKCNGAADGVLDVTVSGGTGPYSYSWGNGAITQDISSLTPGNYSLSVTDANGCTVFGSWTISEPLAVSVGQSIVNVSCFGVADGSIDLTVSGGVSPYSYNWSNGATSQDISNLSGGNYSVTITDANGCETIQNYTINEPANPLTVSGLVTDENCFGDSQGSIALNVTGGTAPYSYSWNTGSSSKDIAGLSQGIYQVTITDANGCSLQQDFTVGGPSALTASATTENISCNGATDGTINLEVNGGTLPYTFAWGNGETSEDLINLSAGNYSVIITDAKGCSISKSYTLSEPTALGISYSVSDVDCFGDGDGAISVNVTGGTLPYTYSWSNGATSKNLNSLNGGSYDLTVTDGNGCILTQSVVVEEPSAPLTLSADVIDEQCFGDNFGEIDLTVTGGTAPYTYSWNNGSSSEDILGLERGEYQVTVTDNNGCSVTTSYTVSGPDVLSVSGVISPISCNAANDGALDLTVTGGTAPYTYSWSNGEAIEDISNLSPGTYNVTITDAKGCSAGGSWSLAEPLPLTINYLTEDVTCFGADDGSIALTVSGGTLPYTYSWNNGESTRDLSSLAGGTYEITVTDARGCQQITQVVIDAPSAPLSATSNIKDAYCNGLPTGEIDLVVSGGTTPYNYQWSNGSNQRDLKNVFAGNYSVTITDAKGCSFVESYTIGEPDALDVDFAVTNTSCLGDSDGAVSVTPIGGTGPFSYIWSNGSTSKNLANVSGGTYNLTITDVNGCSITRSVEVGDSKDLNVDVQKMDVLCKGESTGQVFLDITGGSGDYSIQWDHGPTTTDLVNITAGVYNATITDVNGCSTSASVVISEPAEVLSVELTNFSDLLCYGDDSGTMSAVVEGGEGPYTYLWSNGARTSEISQIPAGDYTVTVTDANGCIVQAQATINQPDRPITISAQGKFNLDCKGDQDGRVVVDVEGGTGLYEFIWSTGATTSSIANLKVGDYTLRVKDGNGCIQERVFTIKEPEELSLEDALVNESQCYDDRNGSIELNIKGGVEPYSYQWSTGATTKNLIGISSGNYSVLVTDANGCQVQGNYNLADPALFKVEPQVKEISCIGANDASISLNIEGGIEPVAIRWSNGASTETVTNLSGGQYNVLITDDNGCTIQQTFNIIEPMELSLDAYIENANRCNDPRSGLVNVIVTGGSEPYNYRWSNGDTTATIENVLPGTYVVRVRDKYDCEIQGTYTVLQPEPLQIGLSTEPYIDCENRIAGMLVKADVKGGMGNYNYSWSRGSSANEEVLLTEPGRLTLEVTDNRGCFQQNSIDIDVPELGLADFNYNAESVDMTGDLAANDPVSFFDLSVGEVVDWHWDFGDGFDSDEIDPIHTYDAPGTYTVKLVVTDRTGCQTEKITILEITEGYRVIIPNAFTPNGDGNNDFFRPRMLGLVKAQLIIYNTWGEVIFSTDDIETKGWDGTIKGRSAENGNYVYKIIGVSFNGLEVEREGIFALIN